MFYNLARMAILLHSSIAGQNQAQPPPQTLNKMHQVLHKAQQKDKAVKVTLKKKTEANAA